MMNENKLARIADYAETHYFADEMNAGRWIDATEPDPDPMVSTSIRLPKSLLDWLRNQAAERGVKHTALIRLWLEEKRGGAVDANERIRRLEEAVFHKTIA